MDGLYLANLQWASIELARLQREYDETKQRDVARRAAAARAMAAADHRFNKAQAALLKVSTPQDEVARLNLAMHNPRFKDFGGPQPT